MKDFKNKSLECKDFVRQLLSVDPKRRLSAKDAMKHPWIQTNRLRNPGNMGLLEETLTNLENFNTGPKLQSAVINFVVKHLADKKDLDIVQE